MQLLWTRRIPKLLCELPMPKQKAFVAFFIAVAFLAAHGPPHPAEATTWNPFLGPSDFLSLSSTVLGAHADLREQSNILAPSSSFSGLFGRSITFSDSDVFHASASQIPGVGAYIGQVSSVGIFGLANEGCNSVVPFTFNLVEANVDVQALAMTPNVTLLNGIGASDSSFAYVSMGDPIGPPDLGAPTRAEIEVDSERMLVTGIDEATNTYSGIVRGWLGTTPATHQAGAQIRKLNVMFPAGPISNRIANLAEDDGDLDNNGTAEFPQFAGNQVADGADAVPSFVRDNFDPDQNPGTGTNGGYITPHARYSGVAFLANSLIVTLQLVVAAPGVLANFPNLDWATSPWGYSTTLVFLHDPLGPPSNSAVSDFCGLTSNTVLYGVPHDNACTGASPPAACTGTGAGFVLRLAVDGGCPSVAGSNPNECGLAGQTNGICPVATCPRSTNPSVAQPLRYYHYMVSQRDYDDDGVENELDVCFNIPNGPPVWDPRQSNFISGSDADGDGLPAACDPNDTAFNNDQDGDTWQNRLDNCPLIANAAPGGGGGTEPNTFQFDLDVPGTLTVADGGPASDGIGVACDFLGNSCSGCPALTQTGPNGHYHATAASQTICVGAATSQCNGTPGLAGGASDPDGDGVVNASDTCRDGNNPPATVTSGPGATSLSAAAGAGATTLNVTSTAGFTQGTPVVIASPLETLKYITSVGATTITINSGVSAAHAAGAAVRMVSFAQSLRDLNNDGFSDIVDISLLTGVFGSQGGNPANDGVGDAGVPGYQGRYDLNYDGFVDIIDVNLMARVFKSAC